MQRPIVLPSEESDGVAHVVWDWNGTLWDDLPLTHRAVDAVLREAGGPSLSLTEYVSLVCRPLTEFYRRVLGRDLARAEMDHFDEIFKIEYETNLHRVRLASQAVAALESVISAGATQSILSMYPHEDLVALVEHLGIADFFTHLEGRVGRPEDSKVGRLGGHLRIAAPEVPPERVLMVGDTGDDMDTARAAGVRGCIICHYGRRLFEWDDAYADGLLDALVRAGITIPEGPPSLIGLGARGG